MKALVLFSILCLILISSVAIRLARRNEQKHAVNVRLKEVIERMRTDNHELINQHRVVVLELQGLREKVITLQIELQQYKNV